MYSIIAEEGQIKIKKNVFILNFIIVYLHICLSQETSDMIKLFKFKKKWCSFNFHLNYLFNIFYVISYTIMFYTFIVVLLMNTELLVGHLSCGISTKLGSR